MASRARTKKCLEPRWSCPREIAVFNQAFLPGNILLRITRIPSGRCSPAEPSSVYDRSKALGPTIFISHRSLAWEPRIETRQTPGLSASTCSMIARASACRPESPVCCISTETAILPKISLCSQLPQTAGSHARILPAEQPQAEYDRGLWRYWSRSLANAETPIGGNPFRSLPLSLLNSNCRSGNCSSGQGCIPRQVSSAPGVSKIGIGAMSQNGCSRSGISP